MTARLKRIARRPGARVAILAVLSTGGTATDLTDAVARCGGRLIARRASRDAHELARVGPRLRAAVGSPASGT